MREEIELKVCDIFLWPYLLAGNNNSGFNVRRPLLQ